MRTVKKKKKLERCINIRGEKYWKKKNRKYQSKCDDGDSVDVKVVRKFKASCTKNFSSRDVNFFTGHQVIRVNKQEWAVSFFGLGT